MASKLAFIFEEKYRLDSVRLRKLQYVADRTANGNKSKAVRLMLDFFAEYLAEEQHQSEVDSRCI